MLIRRLRYLPGLAVIAALLLHSTGNWSIRLIDELELFAYDARVRATAINTVDPRIVVIDVDEKSLAALGQWPWPRQRIADLVDNAFDRYGIAAMGFDVLFVEADGRDGRQQIELAAERSEDETLRRELLRVAAGIGGDDALASSISGRPVVLGLHFDAAENRVGTLPEPVFEDDGFMRHTLFAPSALGYTANLSVLQEAVPAGGFVSNPLIDEDGITRRLSLLIEFEGGLYESLALSVARTYLDEVVEPEFGDSEIEEGIPILKSILLGNRAIPIDSRGAVQIPFRGRQGSFPYVPAADVINGTVSDPAVLRDRIVLLGTTAIGLFDLKATPMQRDFAGVEAHANVIAGILDESFKHRSPFAWAIESASIMVLGLFLVLVLPRISPLHGWLLSGTVLAAVVGANLVAWQSLNLLIPIAATLSTVVGVYVVDVTYGFFFESRTRSQLGKLFGQYVPPELVDEMSHDPESYTLEGEKRELTVLFSDVRNFTVISESMDPQELTRMMNAFLTPMTRAAHLNKGTIDKYMGDAMMAFWGAPVADPEHADHAVKAALEMVSIIDALQNTFRAEGWAEIRVGIGLNSGEMSVGNMGSEFRIAYTVMGDAVNLGSRLEGLTKQYGVPILVSEYTVALATGHRFIELDQVRVKGKARPVSIHAPLGATDDPAAQPTEFLEGHAAALARYRDRRFAEARDWFAKPPPLPWLDTLYGLYLERIELFLATPPPEDWDGVFDFQTK